MTTPPDHGPLRIAYVGNFEPEHSTENHVAETLRRMGHQVVPFQENDANAWDALGAMVITGMALSDEDGLLPHLILWTRTGWQPPIPHQVQLGMLEGARLAGVPTVGFHLDRWWGLQREHEVSEAPFFRCDLVCTADGGHDDEWMAAGVNHLWMPPAVAEWQCGWGTPRAEYRSEVAFVGSWEGYHPEWPWRGQMIRLLAARYGDRFTTWPKRGQRAIRGGRLRDLYASTTVVVGDSCLVGSSGRYWSDRVPETLGRAGLLVHPWVPGLDLQYEPVERVEFQHHTPGDLVVVEGENPQALFDTIDAVLALPADEQYEIRRRGLSQTLERNTYRHRMEQLLAAVRDLVPA